MEDLFSVASRTCRNAQPRADVRRNADPFLGRLLLGQSLTIPVYFLAYPDRTGTSKHAPCLRCTLCAVCRSPPQAQRDIVARRAVRPSMTPQALSRCLEAS